MWGGTKILKWVIGARTGLLQVREIHGQGILEFVWQIWNFVERRKFMKSQGNLYVLSGCDDQLAYPRSEGARIIFQRTLF